MGFACALFVLLQVFYNLRFLYVLEEGGGWNEEGDSLLLSAREALLCFRSGQKRSAFGARRFSVWASNATRKSLDGKTTELQAENISVLIA